MLVSNLELACMRERSVLASYLGLLERMAANILDSWSEETSSSDTTEAFATGTGDKHAASSGLF